MKGRLNKLICQSGLSWLWLTALMIFADRVSKYAASTQLVFQEPVKVFSFLNLTLAYNTGAAFSFLNDASGWQNVFFSGLALVVSIVIVVWLSKVSRKAIWLCMALSLIFAGAVSNAWDRLSYHYVVDFISLHWQGWYFAIFNVADICICVGALMLLIHWARESKSEIG